MVTRESSRSAGAEQRLKVRLKELGIELSVSPEPFGIYLEWYRRAAWFF